MTPDELATRVETVRETLNKEGWGTPEGRLLVVVMAGEALDLIDAYDARGEEIKRLEGEAFTAHWSHCYWLNGDRLAGEEQVTEMLNTACSTCVKVHERRERERQMR